MYNPLNQVMLIGNAGEKHYYNNVDPAKPYAFMSFATNEAYKASNGEIVRKAHWHQLSFSGKLADLINQYFHKGMHLLVIGKLKTQEKMTEKGDRYMATYIKVESIQFLDHKSKSESTSTPPVAEEEVQEPLF
jgi:single-strand DNA-binding protein